MEALGQLCAVVSLGGDVALFGGIATAQRVCLDFLFQKNFRDIWWVLLYPTKKLGNLI